MNLSAKIRKVESKTKELFIFLRQKLKLSSESVAELFLCRYNYEEILQKSLECGESHRIFAMSKR